MEGERNKKKIQNEKDKIGEKATALFNLTNFTKTPFAFFWLEYDQECSIINNNTLPTVASAHQKVVVSKTHILVYVADGRFFARQTIDGRT